jgi:hypothetical protein
VSGFGIKCLGRRVSCEEFTVKGLGLRDTPDPAEAGADGGNQNRQPPRTQRRDPAADSRSAAQRA